MPPELPGKDSPAWEDKWRDDSPRYPRCAKCGGQIGSPEEDEDHEIGNEAAYYLDGPGPEPPPVPVRVFRDHPKLAGKKQEMAFHVECATKVGIV